MQTTDPFSGIRLKLQRAYDQISALKGEIVAFLDGDPYEPAIDFHTRARTPKLLVEAEIRMIVKRPCPPSWSVIIGEIIHNLRSALDHCVYQLVIHDTDAPPASRDKTQFPITLTPEQFQAQSPTMLKGVGGDGATLIKASQPFSTGDNDKSPLWQLNQLSNFDKHRTIHLTGATLESFDFSFPPIVNPGEIAKNLAGRGAFENNTVIARARMVSDKPMFGNQQVNVKAKLLFNIVFGQETPIVGEQSVFDTLLVIADRTRDVLSRISLEILKTEFKV